MTSKICITFAGAIGSSKTPIAYYLSTSLGLPILNNDSIRTEVKEDFGSFNEAEYLHRRDERGKALIDSGQAFIYDASVDRYWSDRKQMLIDAGYKVFIISLDLSKEKLTSLYKAKDYSQALANIDKYLGDHAKFLDEYSQDVCLHITDVDFSDRLELSLKAARDWLHTGDQALAC